MRPLEETLMICLTGRLKIISHKSVGAKKIRLCRDFVC